MRKQRGLGGPAPRDARRRLAAALLAAGGAAMLTACPSSTPPPKKEAAPVAPRAQLVLTGGTVVTLDPAGPKAPTALAVKDGRIVALGSAADVKPWIGPETRVVDLGGHVVVPGLVDSHMHLQSLGMRRFGVDLVGTSSIDEVKARVAEAVKHAKKGEWIQGRGWDQNDWEAFRKKGLKFPTRKDLDEVAPDNPVILSRIDGHAIWVSSKALEVAGITAKTKSKAGGEIVKGKDGKPSGIFIDNAMGLVHEKVPPPTKEQIRQAILLGVKECLSAGLTGVHDMGVGASTLEVLRELDQAGELKLRVYAMLDGEVEDLGALMGSAPTIAAPGSAARLTVRGVKFFADGALGSRGALLSKPYSDDKKTSGMIVTKPEVLEARMRTAAGLGYQVATHAIGDKANTMVLDIYERVFGAKLRAARPRIEHAQVLALEDIPRFGRLGVIPSMQPTHATSDMPWAEQRLGKERIKGAYAWQSLLTTGSTIAAGSDAPVEDISPVLGLYAAIARKDMLGQPEGGWMPEQKMTPVQALAAFTTGAAFASFEEQDLGRVKKGLVADLTVLDKDPLTASEDDVNAMSPLMTIVGGQIAFERPVTKTATSATSAAEVKAEPKAAAKVDAKPEVKAEPKLEATKTATRAPEKQKTK